MDSQEDNSVYEIRAFPNRIDRYSKFISEGFVAIGWPNIGDVTNMSLSDISISFHKKSILDYLGLCPRDEAVRIFSIRAV